MSRLLMFGYWGRRGALTQLTLELCHAIEDAGRHKTTTVSVSTTNESIDEYWAFGDLIFPLGTFRRPASAFNPLAIGHFKEKLRRKVIADRTRSLVTLMPHVWTPAIGRLVRSLDIKHTIVVHDASPHPGDYTSLVNAWLLQGINRADQIVTLSEHVAQELSDRHDVPRDKITVLFHPDMVYGGQPATQQFDCKPLRLLFFGRLLAYKGLDLFLDALTILHQRDVPVETSVIGSGDLSSKKKRMQDLGVRVVNRWISADQVSGIFLEHDIVVLTHVTASQSGVVATAFGSGTPVVAVPVGGLVDQIDNDVTGLITEERSAEAIASAVQRIANDRNILQRLRNNVVTQKRRRSMTEFLDSLSEVALRDV